MRHGGAAPHPSASDHRRRRPPWRNGSTVLDHHARQPMPGIDRGNRILTHLEWLKVPPECVHVVPANEELTIARNVLGLIA